MLEFCPRCENFLYLSAPDGGSVQRLCKTCGYNEPLNPKTSEGALILETNFRSGSSAGGAASGITINDFTLKDPTLPHVKTLRCPNTGCQSNVDEKLRDVIYIKTDPTNLKFQYVCTVCKTQWTS